MTTASALLKKVIVASLPLDPCVTESPSLPPALREIVDFFQCRPKNLGNDHLCYPFSVANGKGFLSKIDQERAKAQKDHEEFRKTPAGKIWERHPYWDRLTCQKIAAGQVWPQMSKEMAGVAVGPPEKVRTEKRGATLYEEWTVGAKEKMVLRFEDNTLISVERR